MGDRFEDQEGGADLQRVHIRINGQYQSTVIWRYSGEETVEWKEKRRTMRYSLSSLSREALSQNALIFIGSRLATSPLQ